MATALYPPSGMFSLVVELRRSDSVYAGKFVQLDKNYSMIHIPICP